MVRFIPSVILLITFIFASALFGQREIAVLRTNEVASINSAAKAGLSGRSFKLEFDRNQLFLKASMEGETGFFMLDTGAPTLLLAKKKIAASRHTIEGQGMYGTVSLLPHTVQSFSIGDLEQGQQSAYLLEINHFSRRCKRKVLGMIGYEQLKNFEILIDAANQQIKFLNSGNNKLHQQSPKASISFEYDAHLPILVVQNGDQQLRLAIDTGAGANLLHVSSPADVPANSNRLAEKVNLSGLDGGQQTINYIRLPDLQLGDISVGNNRFAPADLSHLQNPNGPPIDGIVGMDFLQQFLFSIDFRQQRLYVWNR